MEKNDMMMKIDAEKFAYTVISSHPIQGSSMEEIAKKQLNLYLVAYFLAENFNNLELQHFDGNNMEENEYEDFMLKLSGLRAFR